MGLAFINRHPSPVDLCLLWYNPVCADPPWRKTGWWYLPTGHSLQVLTGNLNSRYYYFHARAANGNYWGQPNRKMLVSARAFNICMGDILEPSFLVPLHEIDTGQYSHFTVTLI